jgi:site-specific DNA-methyltransferase (adenine-specific)
MVLPKRPQAALPPNFSWQQVATAILKATDISEVIEFRKRLAALSAYLVRREDKEAARRNWLLCARRIGELLGPVEFGQRTDLEPSLISEGSIGKDDRYRFRLLAENWDIAEQLINEGTLSQSAIITAIERQRRQDGTNPITLPEDIDLRHCAAADLDIEANSVDLILTDPPYGANYIGTWADLAKLAFRVLRPSGILVAYSGQMFVREALAALSEQLEYVWLAAIVHDGAFFQLRKHKIQVAWKPLLVFGQPPLSIDHEWIDTLDVGRREKTYHGWQQAEAEAAYIVEAFTVPSDLVIDPFLGGGTIAAACRNLGRRFVGCDIDPTRVDRAKERLA